MDINLYNLHNTMAVRIKDGEVPYTGGIGIEITNNHVINVLLRELNNLIHVTEDRELYVDLQLDDGIKPEDSLPVGVTTGRILQEDGRPQSGTILNWKTTSGDQVSLIYANDDSLYFSVNGGEWRLLGGSDTLNCNVRRFTITDLTDATEGQPVVDWINAGKYAIIEYQGSSYLLATNHGVDLQRKFLSVTTTRVNLENQGYSYIARPQLYLFWDSDNQFDEWQYDTEPVTADLIFANFGYSTPFNPTDPGDPATKNYVDLGLATKQDILTAGDNITIDQNNVISATIPSALVYKGNVQNVADLPSSGQTVGDTYFVEGADGMYSWDGTQWNYVGSTSPSLTNYFNKTVDDSDDITEGSIHLFCTTVEKNYWNSKQDALTAGDNINIDANNVISSPSYVGSDYIAVNNHVISNLKPFIPENDGALGQVLKKTSTGYEWKNDSSNFNPENAGSTGQVLKKTETGYAWANESGGGGGGGGGTSYNAGYGISILGHTISNTKPFDPASGTGTAGQVLTKTANGYEWDNIELPSGENNVKFWSLNSSTQDNPTQQEIYEWLEADANNGAIINDTYTNDVFVFYKFDSSDTAVFYGTKRISRVSNAGTYTSQYQQELLIYDGVNQYNILVHENSDDDTHTNYISAQPVGYTGNFMPQLPYQPASKAYVDAVAAGSVQVPAITNNATGTTYTVQQIWVGTQAQYDALTPLNGVIYNIIPSS